MIKLRTSKTKWRPIRKNLKMPAKATSNNLKNYQKNSLIANIVNRTYRSNMTPTFKKWIGNSANSSRLMNRSLNHTERSSRRWRTSIRIVRREKLLLCLSMRKKEQNGNLRKITCNSRRMILSNCAKDSNLKRIIWWKKMKD